MYAKKEKISKELITIYNKLNEYYGDQNWWPADTREEVIIGTVLGQFTTWKNAKKAIDNLKENDLIMLQNIAEVDTEKFKQLIRSAGYFNKKTEVLKTLINYILLKYDGNLDKMFDQDTYKLREQLLNLKGIGPETADSILLYAGNKLVFVVDAYTKRILSRISYIDEKEGYNEIQKFFMNNLPKDVALYNQYHALLVKLGSSCCYKKSPDCSNCPISNVCSKKLSSND